MVLTNAERQKRHRERLKAAASAVGGLTPEQIADRDAVMSEPLYPVPSVRMRQQMPRFMGWERYEWSVAPEPLIDHFGMRLAWERWRKECEAMHAAQNDIHASTTARTNKIIAECGEPAHEIVRTSGQFALFRAYEKDPTLGVKTRGRKRVT